VTQVYAKLLLAATAAFLLPAALAAQADSDDANSVARELQQNHYQQAVVIADRILTTRPADCQVLTLRGIALSREGQRSSAQESFAKALQSCPESLPALEGAAQIAYTTRSPAAADLLRRILLQRPDDQTSHAMLGSLSFQHGDCSAAVEHFERSLPLVQKSEEAQRELGSCLFSQGAHQKAEEFFRRIAEQDPSEKNLLQLAFVQWKSKDPDAALVTLRPLLNASSSSKPFSLAAQIAEEKGDTPHAVEWLRTAILKDPSEIANYLLFATISFNHASYKVGIDVVDAGLRQLPDAAKLYLARGVLQVQLSQFGPAVADFEKAHALDPKLSFVEDAMGMIRSQQHDWAGSLAIFQKQAGEHPKDPLLQYLYAEALSQENGNTDHQQNAARAIAAVKKSLELEPDYQPAHDLLCTLLLRTNQYGAVVDQAAIALQHDPTDQSALYEEIQAQRRLGNKDAIGPLVKRLEDLKRQQQVAQSQYSLQEANTSQSSP
jgi:tetratricopeptide (TPR) repeat protein